MKKTTFKITMIVYLGVIVLCGNSLGGFTRNVGGEVEVDNACRDRCQELYDEKKAFCNSLPHTEYRSCLANARRFREECKGVCD